MTPLLETLKQVREALKDSVDLVQNEYDNHWAHGIPSRKAQIDGLAQGVERHLNAITSLTTLIAEIEKAEPVDRDINSMDAAVWAKAFAERFTVWSQAHGVESDTFGLMVGWFANASMAGYDEATRRHPAPAIPEVDCAVCTNRGGLYGLSQETNCEHCLWQGHWHKKDLFAAPEPKP